MRCDVNPCCDVQMEALCDQGCRPVGGAATVTSSHRGTIMQLDHQTALLVVSPVLLLAAPSSPYLTLLTHPRFGVLKQEL